MLWGSVVNKLWLTILVLVSVVLGLLTFLLLEFFGNFHIEEAEESLMQTAAKVSILLEEIDDRSTVYDTAERVQDPNSRIAILQDDELWISEPDEAEPLPDVDQQWLLDDAVLNKAVTEGEDVSKQLILPNTDRSVIVVGTPLQDGSGAVYVYQSLSVVKETGNQTTQIILLGAGIAFVLTTVFAFFLSSRITKPLIKMQDAALNVARGEFGTKVPVVTHDEIGMLATALNKMGKQLEFNINALSQEKEHLARVVNAMVDGVVMINRQGELTVTNPPAEEFIHDWQFENGETFHEVPGVWLEIMESVVSTASEVTREVTIQGREWVIIATPLYDDAAIRGAVAVVRDMTQERRLNKLREDFITNITHELRTPISLLQGYSEAIIDDIADTIEAKNELAQIIHDESLRIGRLVNQSLDLARMEAGDTNLVMEEVEINPFLERIVRKFQGLADEREIKLGLVNAVDKRTYQFAPDAIEQVLTNLIDNAITHTENAGAVQVLVSDDKDQLVMIVKDSGSGIPEEDLPFVFERFYKADKSRTRKTVRTGNGLGLAIAKNIIQAHDGTIKVTSKLHEGTTFTIRLPRDTNLT
ncbi:PAS domain-containing sensor histidine kinase [Terribacillus saccharophilus]|jgi:two-component system, OmpR family, sensor histidine kinase ResE|uniref:histidine kinase n=1 Tax=Terribacillus saccharophilus TaxID=361277 RepID=A0A268HFH9_9BACI|nr:MULTISPECIES: ATP-binding protein [Terribacillus]PAD36799.1 PAS domain-containing sensor histidine kinase [Terribacillus saccharophilus]PAD97782.1 PAS domain-containing sensor histidine kinase [Terribacillus saccharophilus]PAE01164.1 PAS domain-containing sensor histidine kinase [Terribacillus saccharophilus]PAE08624.1 PAS domain-containing sensor histidine kinase [Terribacillus saccharophilus]